MGNGVFGGRVDSILITLCLSLALFTGLAHAQWQGEMRTDDGTLTVLNPETPADGERTLELNELWRIGGYDEDILFGIVSQLLHDDEGNIYLLDGQLSEVQVFDPDGQHLRTMGRSGEGPGEFVNGTDMFWAPGDQLAVVQVFPGKIVQLTRQGDPGTMFPMPFRDGGGFQVASRGFGVGESVVLSGSTWTTVDEKQLQIAYLKAYDDQGEEQAHYYEEAVETQFGNWEFNEETFSDFQRRWAAAADGRVAASLSFADYRIHIWNGDGTLERVIERQGFRPVPRTDREKKRFQILYDRVTSWNPGSTFQVSDSHPTVSRLFFRDDGNLWIQTSRDMWRADADEFTGFDVYDREGRYLERVRVVADADAAEDGVFFIENRAYVVTSLFSAVMSSFGGDETDESAEEPEPVSIIAYEF